MKGFWKNFAFTAALFVISFGCLYAAGAKAQTVGNMPNTQNVHVCDGAACDDVPTVPAERQLKGLTDFIKSLLGPLESRVTDLETLVSSLLTRVSTLEGQVTTLQGQQAAAPTQSQITALQQQITQLQATVTALQAGGPGVAVAWWTSQQNAETYNLTANIVARPYVSTFTFATPRPNANYAVFISENGSSTGCSIGNKTVTSFGITNCGSYIDSIVVFDN